MNEFEWDARKAEANLAKHKIDFEDAIEIFERPVLTLRSEYRAEERFVSIGLMGSKFVAVVWTPRSEITRIISARSARHEERKAYRQSVGQ
jgi:uncharacterized DUF497 family protein